MSESENVRRAREAYYNRWWVLCLPDTHVREAYIMATRRVFDSEDAARAYAATVAATRFPIVVKVV